MNEVINEIFKESIAPYRSPTDTMRYLEIGVNKGATLEGVLTKIADIKIEKEGVDPYGEYSNVHRMTSEMFFALNKCFWQKTYDIIFIDGCHFSPVVDREIQESLRILNDDGVIILDDTIPLSEASGTVREKDLVEYCKKMSYPLNKDYSPDSKTQYEIFKNFSGFPDVNGDVWKSVLKLRQGGSDLKICSLPHPTACTIVKRGHQELMKRSEEATDWAFFEKNKQEILHLIDWHQLGSFLQ